MTAIRACVLVTAFMVAAFVLAMSLTSSREVRADDVSRRGAANRGATADQVLFLPYVHRHRRISPRIVAHIGGKVGAIAVRGDHALIALGSRLAVVDLTNADAQPQALDLDPPVAFVREIILRGDYAYVSAWHRGLFVLDVSDIANPTVVGFADVAYADGPMALGGNVALLVSAGYSVTTIDISEPRHPRVVSDHSTSVNLSIHTIATDGKHYYAQAAYTYVVEISDPARPKNVSVAAFSARGMEVRDGLAYVVNSNHGALTLYDVSDPSVPKERSRTRVCGTGSWHHHLELVDDTAYIACSSEDGVPRRASLEIYDVSEPAAPGSVGRTDIGDIRMHDIDVEGNRVHLPSSRGITTVDVTDPEGPREAIVHQILGDARALAATGTRLIVDDPPAGRTWTYDISVPSEPTPVSISPATIVASEMVTQEDQLLVAGIYNLDWFPEMSPEEQGVLATFDLSDGEGPSQLGLIHTDVMPHIAVSDTVVYGSNGETTLRVFDVSIPSAPREAVSLEIADEGRRIGDVAVLNNMLLVAAGPIFGDSQLLDVSLPLRPAPWPVDQWHGGGLLEPYETRLFQTGLVEYEAVGRRWPIKTAELDISAHAAIVALQNHIVVAGGALSFVDVSTPGEPVLMATIDLRPNYVQDMAAVDDYLYVTTGRDGLLVISGWE